MESVFVNPERIMDEELKFLHHDHHSSNSCSSSSSIINGEEEEEEEDEDEGEEVNSSSPLQDMSSLLLQLPLKRGLSKHYNGKSQSFTNLSNVKCIEDVAKQENPFNKKLKTCKTYGGGFARKHTTSKKASLHMGMGSHLFSRFSGSRNSSLFNYNNYNNNISSRPPIPPPHRSTSSFFEFKQYLFN